MEKKEHMTHYMQKDKPRDTHLRQKTKHSRSVSTLSAVAVYSNLRQPFQISTSGHGIIKLPMAPCLRSGPQATRASAAARPKFGQVSSLRVAANRYWGAERCLYLRGPALQTFDGFWWDWNLANRRSNMIIGYNRMALGPTWLHVACSTWILCASKVGLTQALKASNQSEHRLHFGSWFACFKGPEITLGQDRCVEAVHSHWVRVFKRAFCE